MTALPESRLPEQVRAALQLTYDEIPTIILSRAEEKELGRLFCFLAETPWSEEVTGTKIVPFFPTDSPRVRLTAEKRLRTMWSWVAREEHDEHGTVLYLRVYY